MSKQKLVTLQIDLYEDYDDVTTTPTVRYYTTVYWSGTETKMVSPLFDKPLDALKWAGGLIA